MRIHTARLAVLLIGVVAGACVPPPAAHFEYDISLKDVQRPADALRRYGEIRITPVSDSGMSQYRFEDALLEAVFLAEDSRISFSITNRSEFPIQLLWTEAAFMGIDGQSQPVMHEGVKYTDCSATKAPAVIIGRGKLTDVVIPCGAVSLSRYGAGWVEAPFLPMLRSTLDSAESVRKLLLERTRGKVVRLLLPLKNQDVVSDYTFTFEIKNVLVTEFIEADRQKAFVAAENERCAKQDHAEATGADMRATVYQASFGTCAFRECRYANQAATMSKTLAIADCRMGLKKD